MKYTPDEMLDILEKMENYGGSFVKNLAACYRSADVLNKRKLFKAFKKYFEHYYHF